MIAEWPVPDLNRVRGERGSQRRGAPSGSFGCAAWSGCRYRLQAVPGASSEPHRVGHRPGRARSSTAGRPAGLGRAERLHELAHEGDTAFTPTVVATTTRGLAVSLGVGKDAIGGALRTLRSLGLITLDTARSDGGRFGNANYRLHTPPEAITSRSIRAHTTRTVTALVVHQPSPLTSDDPQPTQSAELCAHPETITNYPSDELPAIEIPTSASPIETPEAIPTPPSSSSLIDNMTPSSTAPLARRGRRRPSVDVSQLSLLGDVASVVEGHVVVGVNQFGMDGSRTCISDAFNVATGVSLRIDPDPVLPCPENTDTDTNTDTGSGGLSC